MFLIFLFHTVTVNMTLDNLIFYEQQQQKCFSQKFNLVSNTTPKYFFTVIQYFEIFKLS